MGRKRAAEKKPEPGAPGAATSKTDAVRAAIADGVDKPSAGAAYVKEKFGLDLTPQHFSSIKSQQKARAGKAPGRRGRKPGAAFAAATTGAPGSSTNGPASLALSVEAIKTLVDRLGVDQVVGIARLFEK